MGLSFLCHLIPLLHTGSMTELYGKGKALTSILMPVPGLNVMDLNLL